MRDCTNRYNVAAATAFKTKGSERGTKRAKDGPREEQDVNQGEPQGCPRMCTKENGLALGDTRKEQEQI